MSTDNNCVVCSSKHSNETRHRELHKLNNHSFHLMFYQGKRLVAFLLVAVCISSIGSLAAVSANVKLSPNAAVIDSLLTKSALISHMLGAPQISVNCSCSDYCAGNCFTLSGGCALCEPSAFSWPGGQSLCFAPGPLGCGLLCKVGPSGVVTQDACCNINGPSCYLPPNSCCSGGDCSTCKAPPPDPRPGHLPSSEIFPPLNGSRTRCRRRVFVNATCMYA